MNRQTSYLLWRLLALAALITGIIGIVLPLLPTAPFLILSAWAEGKGWPALEKWLLEHKKFGPKIRAWRQRRDISRRAKILATVLMACSALILQFVGVPLWLRITVPILMLILLIWLWRRPEE